MRTFMTNNNDKQLFSLLNDNIYDFKTELNMNNWNIPTWVPLTIHSAFFFPLSLAAMLYSKIKWGEN